MLSLFKTTKVFCSAAPRVLVLYERPFLKLHALNSRKIQISRRLILQCCQKLCDPTVSPTRGSIWFTQKGAYRNVCWILTNVQLYIYWRCTCVLCMYVHKKRLLYANHFSIENFKKTHNWWHSVEHLFWFEKSCVEHASKVDWSILSLLALLSNMKIVQANTGKYVTYVFYVTTLV